MPATEFSETKKIWVELRLQASRWKTNHAKAIAREVVLRAKVQELEETLRNRDAQIKKNTKEFTNRYERIVRDKNKKIEKISKRVEELKAQNAWLKQQIFGRKNRTTQ